MDNQFEIALDNVGFAIFNPSTLQSFVVKHDLSEDIFDEFQLNPLVGDDAIKSGIVVPVYSIPPIDYQIICTQGNIPKVKEEWIKFITHPFPLLCIDDGIVVSDISVLMDWDYEFCRNLSFNTDRLPYNAFSIPAGNYSLKIVGFCEQEWSGSGPLNKGYELLLQLVDALPVINGDIDSDSIDYVVYGNL